MIEALHAIYKIPFKLDQLWEGCIDERFLQYFYESGYVEAMTCGIMEADPKEDDLEG